MLQARLVVNDHIGIRIRELVHRTAQDVIGRAVAPGSFRPAHGQQVELGLFGQRLLDAEIQIVPFAHTAHGCATTRLPGGLFPHIAHGIVERHTQGQIQIGAGVGVNGQHRALVTLGQMIDDQRRDRRLARAALAGHSYRLGHVYPPIRTVQLQFYGSTEALFVQYRMSAWSV